MQSNGYMYLFVTHGSSPWYVFLVHSMKSLTHWLQLTCRIALMMCLLAYNGVWFVFCHCDSLCSVHTLPHNPRVIVGS
jgi:hypothetical protein